MLYNPNYMTFWKGQNYGNNKSISGCPGIEEKGQIGEAQGIFKGSETILMIL